MTTDTQPSYRIAVIGGGVAGLTTAYLLDRKHRVTLFERNNYAGGHTRTITVPEGPDAGTPVDTGFIVMNDKNYPLFTRLLDRLGVERRDSDMSFSYACERSGYAYAGSNFKTLFARKSNFLRGGHWSMIRDIIRFNKRAKEDLMDGAIADCTLGDYVGQQKFGKPFQQNYLLAMGSAIWSAPLQKVEEFPAEPFINFFFNHGLLNIKDRPQWKYVAGGSQTYVRKILAQLEGRVHLEAPATNVRRTEHGVAIRLPDGKEEEFDKVVMACHADETFQLLEQPTPLERELLGAWSYQKNHAVLHSDPIAMPPPRGAWASWNFMRESAYKDSDPVSVTYDMTRLQCLDSQQNYFVSLNRLGAIEEQKIIDRTSFMHPAYTFESMNTQSRLPELNSNGTMYFCGSYFGYGFHEDAVRSAVQVAKTFGIEL